LFSCTHHNKSAATAQVGSRVFDIHHRRVAWRESFPGTYARVGWKRAVSAVASTKLSRAKVITKFRKRNVLHVNQDPNVVKNGQPLSVDISYAKGNRVMRWEERR
jgi:hypothetical protein